MGGDEVVDLDAPFRVLAICTGNLFRSPAAEFLLRQALPEDLGITVTSAGTQARPGLPVAGAMAALLDEFGIDTHAFHSSPLTEAHLRQADLVLGMARAHRSAAVTLVPSALRRSYTLKEFARLTQAVPAESIGTLASQSAPKSSLAALTRHAAAYRGPVRPEDDDIVDPLGMGEPVVRAVFAEIQTAVEAIARVVSDR